jgi:hypothetical protein
VILINDRLAAYAAFPPEADRDWQTRYMQAAPGHLISSSQAGFCGRDTGNR